MNRCILRQHRQHTAILTEDLLLKQQSKVCTYSKAVTACYLVVAAGVPVPIYTLHPERRSACNRTHGYTSTPDKMLGGSQGLLSHSGDRKEKKEKKLS
jgi:hypothetical protein